MISCSTSHNIPSATTSGPRTIIIARDTISEIGVGGIKSWYCKDYITEGPILVELGYFGDPTFDGIGFILYDGGYSGEPTLHERNGLDHRWDWGSDSPNYSFVITPDGTGLYYDFSTVPKGEKTKPSAIYKCYQRK